MIEESFNKLHSWVSDNGWEGYDPYDVRGTKPFQFVSKLSNKNIGKYFAHPFLVSEEKFRNPLRDLMKVKKQVNPKAMALFASGYLQAYKKLGNELYLSKARECLSWLESNPSQGYSGHCWGYPFDWQARITIPKGTPSGVVTSIAAHAFLDAYERLDDEKYLDVAKSCCNFIVNDLNIDKKGNSICFSYTPLDNFHVHNANLFSASALLRTHSISKNEKYLELGKEAMAFTVSHQREDGSWYYWAPPDVLLNIIDNYHTGFVLDALFISREALKEEFPYEEELRKGLDFYKSRLFLEDGAPKILADRTYPIDIHSCSQGILTFSRFAGYDADCRNLAQNVAKWTIENMQDEDGHFCYRQYENGYIDRIPYIRWSQAWMLLALSALLSD